MSRWDAAVRAVPPPSDPKQRQVVEKLAEFRARNGEAFVDVVRSKQSGNPLYAFLDPGREDDPVAKYYLQCVEARSSGPVKATAGPSSRVLAPNPPNPTGTNVGVAFVSNDDFPAGLIPSLARAANAAAGGRNDTNKNTAYTPIHPNDIPGAHARAEAAFAAHEKRLDEDPEAARAYLADRLERFAQDLEDGGAARLRQRDRERAEADGLMRERRREELERIRYGDEATGGPGAVKKTWPSRGKRDRGGGGGGGGSGGPARPGLGSGRSEEAEDDAFMAFRKKRSGTYHAMIGADRRK